VTTRIAYETLRGEILQDLKRAMPVNMVLLGLHGAMVADGYDDCEGDMLQSVRAIVGEHVVIGAELDPHAHISQEMVDAADVLVTFKEYPHKDVFERAEELVELCTATYNETIRPVAALVDSGVIVPFHTTREPARSFVDRIKSLEGKDGILSISIVHGFATGDVPNMGTKVLVYADSEAGRARTLANKLAEEIRSMKETLLPAYPSAVEAVTQALHDGQYPVILADRSDNPGSGAPGDSTYLLREMLGQGVQHAVLGPLWDPVAVQIAFDAGEGAVLPMRVGGKVGPLSGDPVDGLCSILSLRENMKMSGNAGTTLDLGDCALIEMAGIQVALISIRTQAFNIDLFTQFGVVLKEKTLIVVKSAQHFYDSFSSVSERIIYVGAPGVATPAWEALPYRKILRPKWPIDSI
jgi:microcystin degradation protein MlrC